MNLIHSVSSYFIKKPNFAPIRQLSHGSLDGKQHWLSVMRRSVCGDTHEY